MNCEEIKAVVTSLGMSVKNDKKGKHSQHIRILVTGDYNDADYVRKESIIYFQDSELPVILAGLKAFANIGYFEEYDASDLESKTALWNWSMLEAEEDKISLEEYSFFEDDCLRGFVPFSEEGCCCGEGRVNGCHSLDGVKITIVDEFGKILDVEVN